MTLHTQLDWHCHFVQFSYVEFAYTISCLYLFLPRDIYADLDIYTRICDSPYAFITSVADIIISFSIGMRLSITSFSDETMYFCVYIYTRDTSRIGNESLHPLPFLLIL
jgi:hypothetical protein